MKRLSSLATGSLACLRQIGGERSFRRRLMELGLLPGSAVRIVRRADVGGVMELEVRRCRVVVRISEADALLVDA